MGWLIQGAGKGQGRGARSVAGLALGTTLAACTIDPPQPPFELSPTPDQISQVLKSRFAATNDAAGAPCSSDFALTDVAVRESAQSFMTTRRSYGVDVDMAYTATLTKPATNLKALTDACFPSNAGVAAWAVGQSQTIFASTQMSWATTGWTLRVGGANANSDATYPFANAATPHPYKMGGNGRLPR
jgi:hypothetical protein